MKKIKEIIHDEKYGGIKLWSKYMIEFQNVGSYLFVRLFT